MNREGRRLEEREIDLARSLLWCDRDTRLDEVEQRRSKHKEADCPHAKGRAEAVIAQHPFHDERKDDARKAGACPHDPICEALAFVKPFVHVQDTRRVGEATTDGVDNALRYDELPRVIRQRAQCQSETHDEQSAGCCPALVTRPYFQ